MAVYDESRLEVINLEEAMDDQDPVRTANEWLDSHSALRILQDHFEYTTREIDELCLRYTGKRCCPSVISKFVNRRPQAPAKLPGVSHVAIRVMADTATGIARRSLLNELEIRAASAAVLKANTPANRAYLKRLLRAAQFDVTYERRLIAQLARPISEHGSTERDLDLASVDYLEGQINIHAARLFACDESDKLQRLGVGFALMAGVTKRLDPALRAGPRCAETIDLMLGVNARLNGYFVAYEIDDLKKDAQFGTARLAAEKIAEPLFLAAARHCATLQNDPRVLFNAASGTGLAGQNHQAKKHLELAAELDGFKGDNILNWYPDWMTERLSEATELAEALKLINGERK
ncbi:hypothetical protein [Mesorhizobium sp. AA22]|uniref:hypothetical protein n=1 Tax=Mesorhizobium sp. AA22 TaxID=1854057 RepID=UPI0007ECF82A|nr:hypothetical protein [Mesorhizobium sp. AA22]QIA24994.1 hypothetical protein A9K68_026685 [Mesorhizobium sp. AA22]